MNIKDMEFIEEIIKSGLMVVNQKYVYVIAFLTHLNLYDQLNNLVLSIKYNDIAAIVYKKPLLLKKSFFSNSLNSLFFAFSSHGRIPFLETSFTLIYCPIVENLIYGPRRKKKTITFSVATRLEAEQWYIILKSLIYPNFYPLREKKNLTIFVNPISGDRKNGLKNFFKNVLPLLEATDIFNIEIIVTKYKHHALETVRDHMNFHNCHGIIGVGGDGIIWEILNGIMQRNDWRKVISKVFIGVIPCGRGNGLACSIGIGDDIYTATLFIIKTFIRPMDILRIKDGNNKDIYGFLQMSWGLITDIAHKSESFNWMGNLKYIMGGATQLLITKSYYGRFSFLPYEENTLSNISKCKKYHSSCQHCLYGLEMEKKKLLLLENDEKTYIHPPSIIEHKNYSLPPPNWKVIEDKYIYFLASNLKAIGTQAKKAAPHAHFADGYIDVVISRKSCKSKVNKIDLIHLVNGIQTGKYIFHDAIEYYKVKAFTLEPLDPNSKGIIEIDGESIEALPVSVECLRGLLLIISSPPTILPSTISLSHK